MPSTICIVSLEKANWTYIVSPCSPGKMSGIAVGTLTRVTLRPISQPGSFSAVLGFVRTRNSLLR